MFRQRLIEDKLGNLYGIASAGGNQSCTFPAEGCGVVFEITP
jgi:hypothetical protein